MVRSNLGLQKEALLDINNAIKINPKYSAAYYVSGLIKNAVGDNNGGCFDLSKAGELGYAPAYNVIKDYCN
jgi:hypothetical protein